MGEIGSLPSALNGANTVYLADLHAKWSTDPRSVDASFADLFKALDAERAATENGAVAPAPVQS
ncbi:2-oxoglutarate dehydrogenase E1 subunit family protein, partial [Asaia astilbis]|uniref:2-oxoglutarate dehydrogenase E1 subunit family protein n=1 Tax=Asaia astilbis TaxID=610244 RepID=UPI00055A8303